MPERDLNVFSQQRASLTNQSPTSGTQRSQAQEQHCNSPPRAVPAFNQVPPTVAYSPERISSLIAEIEALREDRLSQISRREETVNSSAGSARAKLRNLRNW